MEKISKKEHWNNVYEHFDINSYKKALRNMLKLQTHRILYRIIPHKHGLNFFEIGCAPGIWNYYFNKVFHCTPGGIDYSFEGLKVTRYLFRNQKWDMANLFFGDFLDGSVRQRICTKFDIVLSAGFIEHFSNPIKIADYHLKLLKKGGHLIITVPNLTLYTRVLQPILNKEVYLQHNLKIMRWKTFLREFKKFSKRNNLKIEYLGLVESFSFGQLYGDNPLVMKLIYSIQFLIDFFIKPFIPNNRFTSPTLLFIAKKT